jgi:hypothetical protein
MKQNTKINTKNTKKNTKIKNNTRLRKRTYKKVKNHKNTLNAKRKIGGNGGYDPPPTTRKRERKNDDVNNEINDNNKKVKTDNPIHNFFKQNTAILSEGVIPIKGINRRKNLVKPTDFDENEYGTFMHFLRIYIRQPFIRKLLVNKYNPEIPYAMLRIGYVNNDEFKKKITFIRTLLDDPEYNQYDFILDLAVEQDENGGGHYCSLKREDGEIEYMDSDPFVYNNESHPEFTKLVSKYNNPSNMYPDNNRCKNKFKYKSSIQNINKFDYFCQSWSLLYMTIPGFMDLPRNINYSSKIPIEHTENEKQKANFPLYIENLKILISFWITLLQENSSELNELIENTQFENWESDNIIEELNNINTYIGKLMNDPNMTPEQKYEEYEEIINSYTQNFTMFIQK